MAKAKAKETEKSQELKEIEQAVKDKFFRDSIEEPLPWIKLDSSINDDRDLQDLRDGYGKDYCWDYINLISELAKRKGHYIDISTESKWNRLSHILEQYDTQATKEFIGVLLHFELIDKSAYENNIIINNRIMRTAKEYAKASAHGKFRVWKRDNKQEVE